MNSLIKRYPFALMALATSLTAVNSVLGKISFEDIPPFLFIGTRYLVIGLMFIVIARYAGHKLNEASTKDIVIQCVLQVVVGMAWFGSLIYTQAINVAILFLLEPVVVYVGSIIFLREPRSNRALAGALVALTGGVLMFGAPALSDDPRQMIGNGLLLIAVFGYAALLLHSKKVITDKNLFTVLGLRFMAAGLAGLLLTSVFENPSTILTASASSLSALTLSITVCGFFGMWLFYKALEHMRAEDSASILYFDPLVGTIAGAVILGETLNDAALVAAGIIIAGVLISHPVHTNRTLYYLKYNQSRFEEFVHWAKTEFDDVFKLVKRYF